jgi:hypothetical protein
MIEDVSLCHFTHQPVRTSIIFSFLSLFATTRLNFPSYSKGKGKVNVYPKQATKAQRGVEE